MRLTCLNGRAIHFRENDVRAVKVIVGNIQLNEKRLYHGYTSPISTTRFGRPNFVSAPLLSSGNYLIAHPIQSRNLVISKIIEAFRSADVTSVAGLSNFIIESTPVTAIRSVYELSEDFTGLPWGANILLCSFLLQFIFSVPVNIYMVGNSSSPLTTGKKHQSFYTFL